MFHKWFQGFAPKSKSCWQKFEQKMVTINKRNEGNPRHSNSPKPYLGQMARNPIVRRQDKKKKTNFRNATEKCKNRKIQKISENFENFRKSVKTLSGTSPGQVRDRSGTGPGQVGTGPKYRSGTGPGQVRDKSEIF